MRFWNIWMIWTGEAATSDLFMKLPQEWRTWNFLPFQMRLRFPGLARYALAAWWLMGAACVVQVVLLLDGIRRGGRDSSDA